MSANSRDSCVAIRLYRNHNKGITFNIHVVPSVTSGNGRLSFIPICSLSRMQNYSLQIFVQVPRSDFSHASSFFVLHLALWFQYIFQSIFYINEATRYVFTSIQINLARDVQPAIFCCSYSFLLHSRSSSVAILGISKPISTSVLFPPIPGIRSLHLSQPLLRNGILLPTRPSV